MFYSYVHNIPCVFTRPLKPFRFDLCPLGEWETQLEMWEKLAIALSLAGLCPLGDKATSASVVDNTLKVIVNNSKMAKYSFSKIHLFDDYAISGLPTKLIAKPQKTRVFDWFDVRSGMEHDHSLLKSDEDFVKKIIFYPSSRFGRQSAGRIRKDLVAVSHLYPDDLGKFENSDTMARFKIVDMMKEAGIRGARNGRDPNRPDAYKYYSVKVESMEREVEIVPSLKYEKDDRFIYPLSDFSAMADQYTAKPDTYATKILNIIKNNP